jgi:hypothetical protein
MLRCELDGDRRAQRFPEIDERFGTDLRTAQEVAACGPRVQPEAGFGGRSPLDGRGFQRCR